MVKPGATVIDVGVNRTEEGKLVGDVDPAVFEVAGLDDPRAGRRRADDDRDASAQHADSCATSPVPRCGVRLLGASVRPVVTIDVGPGAVASL